MLYLRGMNESDLVLSQYADETTLILDGSEKSFLEALKIIESFGNIFGLKLNNSKTEACGQHQALKAILNYVLKRALNGPAKKSKPALNRPCYDCVFKLQR